MRPCVSVGWGGVLHLIEGVGGRTVNRQFVQQPAVTNNVWNKWGADHSPGVNQDYEDSIFGGNNTIYPAGGCNHKQGAFYYGNFYYALGEASLDSLLTLGKFDGSGLFRHVGQYASKPGFAGPGFELLSPSGTGSHGIYAPAMSTIVHQGNLFFVGCVIGHNINPGTSAWTTILGWTGDQENYPLSGADAGALQRHRRGYAAFAVTKKAPRDREKRIMGHVNVFHDQATTERMAPDRESTHACDAISVGDDIYFANLIDIVRFPGGSGIPQLIRNDMEASSKCFAMFPSGGFSSNGDPVGDDNVLILNGSGTLQSIDYPAAASGAPSGVVHLINLASLAGTPRYEGMLARATSSSNEPQRSCWLQVYDKKLHAFFISATSGYYHLECDGNPRTETNWTVRTNELPYDFRVFDGDLYGFRDDYWDYLYVMHVSKSEAGLYGNVGARHGAGGWIVYQYNKNREWTEICRGGASSPPVGLIPYNRTGLYAGAPSGGNPEVVPSTDYAMVKYDLYHPYGALCDVDVEYTVDNGASWNDCRRFRDYNTGSGLGDGLTNLTTSWAGVRHYFYWDHVSDLGFNSQQRAAVRIKSRLAGR